MTTATPLDLSKRSVGMGSTMFPSTDKERDVLSPGMGLGLDDPMTHGTDVKHVIAVNYHTVNQTVRLGLNEYTISDVKADEIPAILGVPDNSLMSNTVKAALTTDIHAASITTLCTRFQTTPENGLNSEQVLEKRAIDGWNELTPPKSPSYLMLLAHQLVAGFNFILWIAAILFVLCWKPIGALNGATPDPTNAYVSIFLLLVILISACFNTWQEIKSIVIVKSFTNMLPSMATIRRDGHDIQVNARELVLGDIVLLKMGEKVPADIRLISCEGLQVNNSSLTGESEPVHCATKCTSKNYMESANLVFYSSLIVQGNAMGLVVATGDDTVLGQVNKLTQAGGSPMGASGKSKSRSQAAWKITLSRWMDTLRSIFRSPSETSLHKEINHFVWTISFIAFATGSLCLIVWGGWLYQDHLDYMPVGSIIINAISLIVAYVPEGLPVCVTLTLTLIAKRMYQQHVLVRNLAIIETFNSVSFIASDKTGTLTCNKMTVTDMVVGNETCYPIPAVLDAESSQHLAMRENAMIQQMLTGAILCNAAKLQGDGDQAQVVGDAADTAMYNLVSSSFGMSGEAIRAQNTQLAILPFNSRNKLMITANQRHDELAVETCRVIMKGAPEYILKHCTHMMNEAGEMVPLNESAQRKVEHQQLKLGKTGRRVIGMAMQTISTRELAILHPNQGEDNSDVIGESKKTDMDSSLDGFPGTRYVFLGLFALMDPPRAEVPDAIKQAQQAGIRCAMVTGDHPSTATAIAHQVGIFTHKHNIHTLKLGKDSLQRAVISILRNDEIVYTHVLGSKKPLAKDMNPTHGPIKTLADNEPGVEMGAITTPALAIQDMFQQQKEGEGEQHNPEHTVTFHEAEGDIVIDMNTNETTTSQSQAISEKGVLHGMNGFDDSRIMTPQYHGDRRVFLPYGMVVTGSDLNFFDEYMWAFCLSHQQIVFARTTPEQKLRIVKECQKREEIVAVTGDGTNDAPALKSSNLGIAMASGTEVAREAGDLMLMDNNFASIIAAIETGRVVADNLKKVCLYLLPASTWSEMWPVMANVFLGMPLPLYTFEMIVLSVITDVMDAMALVHEKAERAIMLRPPVIPHKNKLVNWRLLFHAYIELGMICSLCGFFNFFWYMQDQGCYYDKIFFAFSNWGTDDWCAPGISGLDQSEFVFTGQSIFFVSLVICNWFNMFSTRTRYTSIVDHNPVYGRGRNLWLFVALGGTILVSIFLTQVTWFNTKFYTRPVPIKYVMPAFGFGGFMLALDEVRKWNWRNRPTSWWAKLAW